VAGVVMSERKMKFEYAGSVFWLIFWLIVFFPIGIILMFTDGKAQVDGKVYYTRYEGSRFWLCFWFVFFFPIALVLLVLNGISLITGEKA
jgi:hypothetical protein